jgi:hypothetical protein
LHLRPLGHVTVGKLSNTRAMDRSLKNNVRAKQK